MAKKKKKSEWDFDEKIEKSDEKFEQSKETKKYKASASRKYLIVNRQNSPNEIIAGRFRKRLEPRGKEGDSCEISEQIYLHEDFKTQRKYFVIKEL